MKGSVSKDGLAFSDFPKCISRWPRLKARWLSIRQGSTLAVTESEIACYRGGRKINAVSLWDDPDHHVKLNQKFAESSSDFEGQTP